MPPSSAPADAPAEETALQAPRAQARVGSFREGRGQDRQGGRRQDGGAQALQCAGAHEPGLVLGQPTQQTGKREDREPQHEDLPPPEQVGGPASEEEEPRKGQGVGVDDPLQT